MSASPWEQDFDVYVTQLDETPVSVILDLNALEHAPIEGRPTLLRVRIAMKKPDENGFRAREEFEPLNKLEDALLGRLVPALDAIHVGHLLLRGFVDLVFYCPASVAARSAEIDDMIGEVQGDYLIESVVQDDADWAFYQEIMYPDPYELQFILNRRLVELIEKNGDDLAAPRQVDHQALFDSEQQAESASEALGEAGFDVDLPFAELTEDDEEVWSLQFHREETIEHRAMDKVVAEILEIILPLDGSYDGWGCPTIKKHVAPGT